MRACLLAGLLLSLATAAAERAITSDDLVRRAQIPIAALSPDGKLAAYLLVRGDPKRNDYEMTIRVVDTERMPQRTTVRKYRLSPEEAFTELGWLLPTAAEMRWATPNTLLFTARGARGQSQLVAWNRQSHDRVIWEGDGRIELQVSGPGHKGITVVTSSFANSPTSASRSPRDLSWRIRDGYRFFGPFKNPKIGRWVRKQRWSLSLAPKPALRPEGEISEGWETVPEEWTDSNSSTTADSETWLFDESPSADGTRIAAGEIRNLNLSRPGTSYTAFRVIVKEGGNTKVLVADTRPYVSRWTSIVGWNADETSVRYLYVTPRATSLDSVTMDGKVTHVLSTPQLLAKPCPYPRKCQIMSNDRRYALLVRSNNFMPAELVKVDLAAGSVTELESPNALFEQALQPEMRFYNVEGVSGDAWGRLYLPLNYRKGTRYPLVITQYASSPGFASDIGDEIPLLPLAANGIAVFDMYSAGLAQSSQAGDIRMEVERVGRPMNGMQWIVQKLADEGIVDPEKVGVTGISYGAEIAMYAYWSWKGLRAVSATTASWDPTLSLFAGANYSQFLSQRGFPAPDESGLRIWRQLAAGPNARADLPPLLFQSPDGEQNGTIPTWAQLRRANAPVEWYEYPNEGHIKRSPANKWWVYSRNLDWFRFWLKGEEDSDPAKAEQYARWRKMGNSAP